MRCNPLETKFHNINNFQGSVWFLPNFLFGRWNRVYPKWTLQFSETISSSDYLSLGASGGARGERRAAGRLGGTAAGMTALFVGAAPARAGAVALGRSSLNQWHKLPPITVCVWSINRTVSSTVRRWWVSSDKRQDSLRLTAASLRICIKTCGESYWSVTTWWSLKSASA